MNIESLLRKHIDQIYEIECESFSVPWSMNSLKDDLENPLANYFVLCEGDTVLGYLGVRTVLDEIHIMNIAIKPIYRGKGYSKLLLDEMMIFAIQGEYKIITLEARQSNSIALSLYEGFGFVRCGIRRDYYELPTENAILMVKYL